MALENETNLESENEMNVQPPEIHVEDINALLASNPSEPFDPELLSKLPAMTSDQLSQLEEVLSSEFTSLSKKFLVARQVRVENMLAAIDQQIKLCQANDEQWTQKYNHEIGVIERLANNTEDHVIAGTKGSGPQKLYISPENFDSNVSNLMSNLVLPMDLDDIFNERGDELPFSPQFKKIIQQFRDQLDALKNQKSYQEDLVDANTEKNRGILWKQYKRDAQERRQQLIDQTYLELNELYKEYYGVADNKMANLEASQYYRSVVSVDDMKNGHEGQVGRFAPGNIDSYYDVDAPYYKNNRIEATDARVVALYRLHQFEAEQRKYTIPQLDEANVKLSGLQGLTQEETDLDLLVLRANIQACDPSPKNNSSVNDTFNSEFQTVLDTDRLPSQVEMEPIQLDTAANAEK